MLGKVQDPYMKRYIDSILRTRAEDNPYLNGTILADFVARPISMQA